ncbi:hypothetical protein LP7551_02354 [Roseibium album]|nr:hypothetical protein LP7551_02354 [Roseibium album]
MKKFIAISILTLLPFNAQANDCFDKISKMFDAGPLDPFVRTPHSLTNTVTDADGNFLRKFQTRWQTPSRSVSGVEGSGYFALVINSDTWTGPTLDGPWTKAPNSLPDDHMEERRRQHEQQRANLSNTECSGETEIDGSKYDVVSFVTRTDPNPQMQDMWFGARHKVFIEQTTGKVSIWKSTDFVSSFAPELSKEMQVQVFTYNETLVIPDPE